MNDAIVRTEEQAARTWRLRRWPNDPTVAHLIFVDHLTLPTPATIDVAVEQARRNGARAVRTSALFPRVAEVMRASGFDAIDRLVLLRRELDSPVISIRSDLRHRPRPFRAWHLPRAAAVDQDAFGPKWGNDTSSLRDIRSATPRNRARLVRDGRTITGFAISGAALEQGYLQRLSVLGSYRRQGIARDLVLDALQWMYDCKLTAAFVNTGVENDPALRLYDSMGFVALDDELIIAERRLTE